MTATYEYARGNLLEERNTYKYAPFGGQAFLNAWTLSRQEALDDLPDPVEPPQAREVPIERPASVESTDVLLERFLHRIDEGNSPPALDSMLQRFEVTKRIHGQYNQDWRPEDATDYRQLTRYVRFAEVLERAYDHLRDLRHLSALLKCNDTLVALRKDLGGFHAARLARLILAERTHVAELDEEGRR